MKSAAKVVPSLRALRTVAGVAFCALALFAAGSSASSRGNGDIRLDRVRGELVGLRDSLSTARARLWLSRSVASLGWSISAGCWTYPFTSGGILPATGSRCLEPLRITVNRLMLNDAELRAASGAQVGAIVAVVADTAHFSYQGLVRDGGADAALFWKVQRDFTEASSADPPHALAAYTRAWKRMNGAGGGPATITLGRESVQPKTDYNPDGRAEAFAFVASGSRVSLLNLYVDPASTATSVVAGIYADDGDTPGMLLAQGHTFPTNGGLSALGGGDWNSIALGFGGAELTPGAKYWVAILAPAGAGTLRFRDRCCRGGGTSFSVMSRESGLTTLPGTWSSAERYKDGPLSLFGSN